MTIREFLLWFREDTGRYDLVDEDGTDNGALKYINRALMYLYRQKDTYEAERNCITKLLQGSCEAFIPGLRTVNKVFLKKGSSSAVLSPVSYEELVGEYGSTWLSPDLVINGLFQVDPSDNWTYGNNWSWNHINNAMEHLAGGSLYGTEMATNPDFNVNPLTGNWEMDNQDIFNWSEPDDELVVNMATGVGYATFFQRIKLTPGMSYRILLEGRKEALGGGAPMVNTLTISARLTENGSEDQVYADGDVDSLRGILQLPNEPHGDIYGVHITLLWDCAGDTVWYIDKISVVSFPESNLVENGDFTTDPFDLGDHDYSQYYTYWTWDDPTDSVYTSLPMTFQQSTLIQRDPKIELEAGKAYYVTGLYTLTDSTGNIPPPTNVQLLLNIELFDDDEGSTIINASTTTGASWGEFSCRLAIPNTATGHLGIKFICSGNGIEADARFYLNNLTIIEESDFLPLSQGTPLLEINSCEQYKIGFRIDNIESGDVTLKVGDVEGESYTEDGTYNVIWTDTTDNSDTVGIHFVPSFNFIGCIGDVCIWRFDSTETHPDAGDPLHYCVSNEYGKTIVEEALGKRIYVLPPTDTTCNLSVKGKFVQQLTSSDLDLSNYWLSTAP